MEPALLGLVKDAIDDLGSLVASHVKLARAELGRDVRAYGRRAGLVGLVAVVLLVGWAMVCGAGALALARVIDPPLAYLAVGALNLAAGGVIITLILKREAPRPLDETFAELDRTVAILAPRPTPGKRADGVA